MNAGAVVGEKAAPNALVGCRQGNVRQVEPDEEVTAQVPARNDHRTRVSLHFQGLPELHGEMSSGLDLRRRLRVPGLEQMPEEADRKIPLILSRPLADPMPARAMAYMAHEAVNEADVERFEAQPAGRQPDRDMPGRADHRAGLPVRKAKAFQTICVTPDSTGIALRNHIGERRAQCFYSHGFSPASVKTDRSGADSYVNLISGMGLSSQAVGNQGSHNPLVPITGEMGMFRFRLVLAQAGLLVPRQSRPRPRRPASRPRGRPVRAGLPERRP